MPGLSFFQPNPGPDAPCPICARPRPGSQRYPDHVCAACVERATDEAGRALTFSNTDFSGGFGAAYQDTNEPRDSHECWIDGVHCLANEARFGGIVVQPWRNPAGT